MQKTIRAAMLSIAALAVFNTGALATDGYFQYGYGASQKALGGAGVADGRDATSTSLNPAGIVNAPQEASFAATLFSPPREITAVGTAPATVPGTYESNSDYFGIPNLAVTYRDVGLPFADVIGINLYGNGGLNTNYHPAPGQILFSTGKIGVDYQQALLSIAFAKQIAPGISVGIAPTIARTQIKLAGLNAFANPGFSSDPANLTDRDVDVSWGASIRGGVEWSVTPGFRVGVAGASRSYQQEFNKYRGLFAEQGDLDIPASLQAGVAIDVTKDLTLLADYKRIWYSQIAAINNPSTNAALFGSNNGPGFGWSDVDVVKIGLEWRSSPDLTLRAGYSYNTGVLDPRDVTLNILAPAVVQHHFTGGFEYRWNDAVSLEFAGAYVPEESITGPAAFAPPGATYELTMQQWEVTAGSSTGSANRHPN